MKSKKYYFSEQIRKTLPYRIRIFYRNYKMIFFNHEGHELVRIYPLLEKTDNKTIYSIDQIRKKQMENVWSVRTKYAKEYVDLFLYDDDCIPNWVSGGSDTWNYLNKLYFLGKWLERNNISSNKCMIKENEKPIFHDIGESE